MNMRYSVIDSSTGKTLSVHKYESLACKKAWQMATVKKMYKELVVTDLMNGKKVCSAVTYPHGNPIK